MKQLERLSEHYNFTTRQEERIEDLIKDIAIGFSQFRDIYKRYESQKMHIYHQKLGGITSWVGDSDEFIYNKFLLGEQHYNPLTN